MPFCSFTNKDDILFHTKLICRLYSDSLARYGKSPYLYPLYGLGELPQVWMVKIRSVIYLRRSGLCSSVCHLRRHLHVGQASGSYRVREWKGYWSEEWRWHRQGQAGTARLIDWWFIKFASQKSLYSFSALEMRYHEETIVTRNSLFLYFLSLIKF